MTGSPNIAIERIAPIKGAVEKYAPVLAAPRCRKARTNRTRLTPYPINPTRVALPSAARGGRYAPPNSAKARFTAPATSPFIRVT